MSRRLNYELLEFHVREAADELDTLMLHIKSSLGESLSEEEKGQLHTYQQQPLCEARLKVSLEHAYHHLNFAWNVRHKATKEADRHFDRDEKFPKAFTRFWSKSLLKNKRIGQFRAII